MAARASRKSMYKRNWKNSACQGQTSSTCSYMKKHCKMTKGPKRMYCRKRSHTRKMVR
jgi:hypothetical protein